jgi:ABC-type uncharacterized transport system ATPase subunit
MEKNLFFSEDRFKSINTHRTFFLCLRADGKMGSSVPLVEMKNIVKIYPDGTIALRGVSIKSYPNEILGLLGENGAGKTTLMKILSGLLRPTEGEIYIQGKKVSFRNPSDALKLGIGMVHQHFTLINPYTALQNIILGIESYNGKKFSNIRNLDVSDARRRIKELMKSTGLEVPLDTPVEAVSYTHLTLPTIA